METKKSIQVDYAEKLLHNRDNIELLMKDALALKKYEDLALLLQMRNFAAALFKENNYVPLSDL